MAEVKKTVFNDPVHGSMEFHPVIVAIINTRQFQRLKDIKQLGGGYFVYPGASHNRFEHSLGVCYLSGQLVRELKGHQPEELKDVTDTDILMVEIAGLCHDLGHGPFSHMFDNQFMPAALKASKDSHKQEHEQLSLKMFDDLVAKNPRVRVEFNAHGIDTTKQEVIKMLIHRPAGNTQLSDEDLKKYNLKNKQFLFEIVANKRNGVDVDKWDYFMRDTRQLGLQAPFDHRRLMKFCRVITVYGEQQICVRDKEAVSVYQMFLTRQMIHRSACQHKTVQAVEQMIVNAFLAAEPVLKISKRVEDMEEFTTLTDSIFYEILGSKDESLETAQTWLRDLLDRKQYRLVAEAGPFTKKEILEKENADILEEILKEINAEDKIKLGEDEEHMIEHPGAPKYKFIVTVLNLDFGKKSKNPVDDLRFFKKNEENKAVAVEASKVSSFLPKQNVREKTIRIMLRPTGDEAEDRRCHGVLQKAFGDRFNESTIEKFPWGYKGYSK